MTTNATSSTPDAPTTNAPPAEAAPAAALPSDAELKKKRFRRSVGIVIAALVVAILVRTLLIQPFTVPTSSMEPNLYVGDYMLISKSDYGYSKYSPPITVDAIKGRIFEKVATRGDVVVFRLDGPKNLHSAKRIIGIPGDTVQMHGGRLYVNGSVVVLNNMPTAGADKTALQLTVQQETLTSGRSYLIQTDSGQSRGRETPVFTVPAGHYFVMGDNRDNSLDSRFAPDSPYGPGIGFLAAENLEGRVVMVLMSWKPGSSIWKPWTWLNLRWNRFFHSVH